MMLNPFWGFNRPSNRQTPIARSRNFLPTLHLSKTRKSCMDKLQRLDLFRDVCLFLA
jgi:hypothetical protein